MAYLKLTVEKLLSDTIEHLEVKAFKVPTDLPESDGTLSWDSTTIVVVTLQAGKATGMGYTYAHESCASLIRERLFPIVRGGTFTALRRLWQEMNVSLRNVGRRGMGASAIAAVDIALWDLEARRLGLPLVKLLGCVRERIPVYGSGGFTSYSELQLCRQLGNWADEGISMVKMKVGREPSNDPSRVEWARNTVGGTVKVFVDANGAYAAKQALELAEVFAGQNVVWFEEPVSSDNLNGLRFVREHSPRAMDISAGEYNYDLLLARQMLEAQAVDVLQADATRCGITGFMQMAALCEAFEIPLSSHTAPAVHAPLCCTATRARHAEYFHDHVRIEQLFFEGATVRQKSGFLEPDFSAPGLGLQFKERDAEPFRIQS